MQLTGGGATNIGSANITDGSVAAVDLASTALTDHVKKVLTIFPRPTLPFGSGSDNASAMTMSGNTTGHVSHIQLDKEILLANIAVRNENVGTTGTYKYGIYSEDGTTRLVSVTTESMNGAGVFNAVVSPAVSLPAGAYWLVMLPVSTVSFPIFMWGDMAVYGPLLNTGVTGKPTLYGTYTCTADTLPTSLTLSSIVGSGATSHCPILRFDA